MSITMTRLSNAKGYEGGHFINGKKTPAYDLHESWPVVYLYSTSIQLQSKPNLS